MPGGFHPFHPGHKSLYDWAVKTFGQSNVYVAATNDTATRPFPFEVKKKLAAMAGVPESNFMQVKSPFNNREYAKLLDDDTALVFVRSDKDKNEQPLPDQTKKNGEPGYLRSYTGKDLNTSDEMGYMAYGPTINFDFSGMQIKSASELRAAWPEMSDEDKLKAAKLMYGNGAEAAVQLLNQALGVKEPEMAEDTSLNELLDPRSNKNFEQLENYADYEIFRTKKKFKDQYFIAQAVHPRTRKIIAKASDESRNGAETKLHAELDKLSSERKQVTGKAVVDFNVEFAKQILTEPGETFYAKIIPGPKLVIAGPEMLEYPEIMKDEGFKKSAIRNVNSPEGTTRLPGIPLTAKQASATNLVANGRYLIGNQSTDKDENLVFDLQFDSQVYDKGDRVRIKKPALTVGTDRNESFEEDASSEEEDKFHVELDKLVHKYFGHSSDEKKKEKYDESDVVLDKTSVRKYIRDMILDKLEQEQDIEKLSKILKIMVGKEVKARGSRYRITGEDIIEACSSMKRKRRGRS